VTAGDADPAAWWVSINANHMLPSGSSIFHPHFQGGAHPAFVPAVDLAPEALADRAGARLRR
jgi:galactose-1-phosphate uridylyltransferase